MNLSSRQPVTSSESALCPSLATAGHLILLGARGDKTLEVPPGGGGLVLALVGGSWHAAARDGAIVLEARLRACANYFR